MHLQGMHVGLFGAQDTRPYRLTAEGPEEAHCELSCAWNSSETIPAPLQIPPVVSLKLQATEPQPWEWISVCSVLSPDGACW